MNLNRSTFLRSALLVTFLITGLYLLVLASPAFAQTDSTQSGNTTTTDTTEYSTYTVRPGDGWGIIAQRFKTTIRLLKELNPDAVRPGDILHVSEVLRIPYQTPVPIATEYAVQIGDGWGVIAARFGIRMSELMDANPQYVRSDLILRVGDKLLIPAAGGAVAQGNEAVVTVTDSNASDSNTDSKADSGQSAGPVAEEASAPVATDTALPTDTPTTLPTETATTIPTPQVTETPAEEPKTEDVATEETTAEESTSTADADSESVTGTEFVTSTETIGSEITGTETISQGLSTAESAAEPIAGCPVNFADYADIIVTKANGEGGLPGLESYLSDCGALVADSFISQDWTVDGVPDLTIVYTNPVSSGVNPESELLILNGGSTGYTIDYQGRPAGKAAIVATFDINTDGKSDIVWSDTNCGSSTCFLTLNVQSWDGSEWQNWTSENITLPEATASLEDRSPEGQGVEIVVDGGTYDNVAAGPQRQRVETWGSVDGKPYSRFDVLYNTSPCRYHAVLDANEAYAKASEFGYDQATQLYDNAFSNNELTPCWTRPNEEDELKSFSLFRLALIAAQTGGTQDASDLIASLNTLYPESPVTPAANVWLKTLEETGNIDGSCAATNEYVSQNPQGVDILADYGYANPGFSAADFCPQPSSADEPAGESAENAATSETTAISETMVTGSNLQSGGTITPTDSMTQTESVSETASISESGISESDNVTQAAQCPADLAGFASALPEVLTLAGRDTEVVLGYLKLCNAANDQNGDVAMGDFNGDRLDDFIVLPSIIADLGFGPNGTQGAVLVYHGDGTGKYVLAYNPETYGGTDLLANEDLNDDSHVDLAWTVTGCGVSCLSETQIVSWDVDKANYESIIRPGAVIAEGKVEIAPVPPTGPGKGRQLVMSGGVSTLPDSGLPVPHTEIWESIDGTPFQRIRWDYDRKVENNDCLGLRLVEAEMALQAAGVLGYANAIDLYQSAVDDSSLKACSIHGLAPETELSLLQGLGRFRLVQALAYSDDSKAATDALTAMQKSSAIEEYKTIATTWLESYQANGEAENACSEVQPLISAKKDLWQITDHYGINHSIMGEFKTCFVPEVSQ